MFKLLKYTFLIMWLNAQDFLVKPTGQYLVGTSVWQWETPYIDTLTEDPVDKRVVIVQLWYPAEKETNVLANYAIWSSELQEIKSNSFLDADFKAEINQSNLIVISPGRGTERYFYTMLAEDLASYGYTVMSIDIPHSGDVNLKNGNRIKPNSKYKPAAGLMRGPYEEVDKFYEEAATLGARDIAFSLQKINELDKTDHRFKGKINLERMGLYGHSLGGRIGGQAVNDDTRFKAFIAMEAVAPRNIRRNGMNAAVAMCLSKAIVAYAMFNIGEVIPLRKSDTYIITLDKFGHNSMTDIPVLDSSAYDYSVDPKQAIHISRQLLRRFFDQYVRQMNTKLTEFKHDLVQIDFYPSL